MRKGFSRKQQVVRGDGDKSIEKWRENAVGGMYYNEHGRQVSGRHTMAV
jgi:hypothetical protein